jgi:hypothetical protein
MFLFLLYQLPLVDRYAIDFVGSKSCVNYYFYGYNLLRSTCGSYYGWIVLVRTERMVIPKMFRLVSDLLIIWGSYISWNFTEYNFCKETILVSVLLHNWFIFIYSRTTERKEHWSLWLPYFRSIIKLFLMKHVIKVVVF